MYTLTSDFSFFYAELTAFYFFKTYFSSFEVAYTEGEMPCLTLRYLFLLDCVLTLLLKRNSLYLTSYLSMLHGYGLECIC